MRLEQFGKDFNLLEQEEQRIFFLNYSDRRAIDLSKPTTFKGPKKSGSAKKKGKNVKVTSEAFEALKGLGLI
jgi:hypothetical protein